MGNTENKKLNPMASYDVTNEEFEFFGVMYREEKKAYWKGFSIGCLFSAIIHILIAITM